MTEEVRELRRFAEKATPGPWRWSWEDGPEGVPTLYGMTDADDHVITGHQCDACRTWGNYCLGGNPDNRAYIAAASPDVILRLLDSGAAAEAVVEAARLVTAHLNRAAQDVHYDEGHQPTGWQGCATERCREVRDDLAALRDAIEQWERTGK